MKKGVIYARYSSSSQTEQSIEAQLLEGNSFAKKNDIVIIGNYIDRAQTGRNDDRTDFQRMIQDSKKKQFDFVIVYQFDRFARNRYDSAVNKNILKKNGVKVLSVKEQITNDPAGILLESMLEGYAEYFSADLSQKVKTNQIMNARQGNFIGGKVTYGYKIINKKFIIDEIQASVVKSIFEQYASNHYTIANIVEYLRNKGIKNNIGNYFSFNSVSSILKNKKYVGILEYNNEELALIPQIVPKEVFDMVNEKMKHNKKFRGSFKSPTTNYILSGKLYCGLCEAFMFGESGTSKTGTLYNYYKCHNNKKYKSCTKKSIPKQTLENIIIKTTRENILKDEILRELAREVFLQNETEKTNNFEIIRIENQLKEIKKSKNNIIKALEQGIITETTKERLQSLEEEQTILEYNLTQINHYTSDLTENRCLFWFKQFQQGKEDDNNFRERLVNTFIKKIYLFENRVLIIFNTIKNNTVEIKLKDIFELKKTNKIKKFEQQTVKGTNT